MRVYKSDKVHLLFGTIIILLMIWLSDAAGLWKTKISVVMTIISMILIITAYFLSSKIPKHDDDIHLHEKDERTPVRH
jgi:hypothetical protein